MTDDRLPPADFAFLMVIVLLITGAAAFLLVELFA